MKNWWADMNDAEKVCVALMVLWAVWGFVVIPAGIAYATFYGN